MILPRVIFFLKKIKVQGQVACTSREKKEEIRLRPMIKAPALTENSKKQRDNTKKDTKNFDYTKSAGRLRNIQSPL